MAEVDNDKIRDRAYALWEQAGAPEGEGDRYWHQAERELAEEGGSSADHSLSGADNATIGGQETEDFDKPSGHDLTADEDGTLPITPALGLAIGTLPH